MLKSPTGCFRQNMKCMDGWMYEDDDGMLAAGFVYADAGTLVLL